MTTAQLFPRTPIEVMLAAVMALKAYSACDSMISLISLTLRIVNMRKRQRIGPRTNLVEASLVGEDGDVSVETRTS
jgi:hypothetical protein